MIAGWASFGSRVFLDFTFFLGHELTSTDCARVLTSGRLTYKAFIRKCGFRTEGHAPTYVKKSDGAFHVYFYVCCMKSRSLLIACPRSTCVTRACLGHLFLADQYKPSGAARVFFSCHTVLEVHPSCARQKPHAVGWKGIGSRQQEDAPMLPFLSYCVPPDGP